jgi:hypothetical protein
MITRNVKPELHPTREIFAAKFRHGPDCLPTRMLSLRR